MNKSTLIKEITSIIGNEFKNKDSLKEYIKNLSTLRSDSLLSLLGCLRENTTYDYNSKTWVSKNIDVLQENDRILQLRNFITLKGLEETKKYYEEQSEIIELDSIFGLITDDITNHIRLKQKIKDLSRIKKTGFALTNKDYKERQKLLIDSTLNKPSSLCFFGMDSLEIGYEYKSGSTEIYKTPHKSLTIIVTDLYNSGILATKEIIERICISLYNKYFSFFDPDKILWIFEIPISKNESKFYEIDFNLNFKIDIRYNEEIYRFNRLYSMDLVQKEDVTVFTGISIKRIKNLKEMITLHKLKSVLSYENIGAI